jgi:Calcineurin-like phosphoesterase
MPTRSALALLAALTLAACEKAPAQSSSARSAKASAATSAAPVPPVTRLPAPARIVAVGDLHGDVEATRAALVVGGVLDDKGHWSGGAATLVQTGDQLDRGDGEHAILDLLDRLADEARAAGGAVVVLDGNHEVMNVQQDYRYVTEGGLKDFAGEPGASPSDPRVVRLPEAQRARGAAFLPGGPEARRLAKRGIVAVIGDTVFVHGGVLPKHVRYGLDRMNREVSAWMEGSSPAPPAIVTSEDGPIWTRLYSAAPAEDDCRVLREALDLVGAARMVVGHTVQRGGVSPACGERVWRIDVGLSRFYGGKPEVLEIAGDKVRAIRAK